MIQPNDRNGCFPPRGLSLMCWGPCLLHFSTQHLPSWNLVRFPSRMHTMPRRFNLRTLEEADDFTDPAAAGA